MARTRRVPPEALAPYLVDVPHPRSPHWRELSQAPRPLVWSTLFGNDHPVEIEVGFGKGMFLVNSGPARPEVNFLGIEIERKYVMLTAARLAQRHVDNVRLACTDARWLLKECVAGNSVQALHIFFPDPWWKHRHQKRKLVTAEFAIECSRVLIPGGVLHFVTDVAAYFDETCKILAEQGRLRRLPDDPNLAAADRHLTHFDRKYRAEGRDIHQTRFVK